jgi:hypothetical protein
MALKQSLSPRTVAIVLGLFAAVLVALGAVYFLAPVKSTAARAQPANANSNHDIAVAKVRADQEARLKALEKSRQAEKPEKKGAPTGSSKSGDAKPAADTSGQAPDAH